MPKGWIRIQDHETVIELLKTEIKRMQGAMDKLQDRFLAFTPEAAATFASLRAADGDGAADPNPGPHLGSLEDLAENEDQADLGKEAKDHNDGFDAALDTSVNRLKNAEDRLKAISGDGKAGI